MKNKLIIGGGAVLLIWSAWFIFSGKSSIEKIADDLVKNEPTSVVSSNPDNFVDSLTMDYGTIDTDVFIGDEDMPENMNEEMQVVVENKFTAFADKYNTLFEKKDFKALCAMTATCNEKTEDYLLLEKKEKDYVNHSFEYWYPKTIEDKANNENILCYRETIKLKNDSNNNPIIYTYHVAIEEKKANNLEFQKPRCEKVTKEPYGDLTNRSPYDKRCGKNITRILCEK